ncbi:MAG: hypothetical protein ABSA72_10645, partial [Nitrososphaerales archaeon]
GFHICSHVYTESLSGTGTGGLPMSTDDKIRYGMMALTGSSVVLAAFGAHVNPLATIIGFGVG